MNSRKLARVRRQQRIRKELRRLKRILHARLVTFMEEHGPILYTPEGRELIERVVCDTIVPPILARMPPPQIELSIDGKNIKVWS